jgi:hypothetical protein
VNKSLCNNDNSFEQEGVGTISEQLRKSDSFPTSSDSGPLCEAADSH